MLKTESKISAACIQEAMKNKSEDRSYNWWNQVEDIFTQAGLQLEFNSLSAEYLMENLGLIITKYSQNSVNEDVKRMLEDNRLKYYKDAKTHITISNYLQDLTWQEVKLIINLRSNFPSVSINNKRFSLNAIWQYWQSGEERSYTCDLCNLKEIEDVYHIMFRCPHYKTPRNCKLKKYDVNSYKEYMTILYKDDVEMWQNFYTFWCEASRIRQLYLSEMMIDVK